MNIQSLELKVYRTDLERIKLAQEGLSTFLSGRHIQEGEVLDFNGIYLKAANLSPGQGVITGETIISITETEEKIEFKKEEPFAEVHHEKHKEKSGLSFSKIVAMLVCAAAVIVLVLFFARSTGLFAKKQSGEETSAAPVVSETVEEKIFEEEKPAAQAVPQNENKLNIGQIEGRIIKAVIGTDSCEVTLRTADKKTRIFSITPSLDFLTKEEQEQYFKERERLPGKEWPVIADMGSKIHLWYIGGGHNYIIKYKVLSAPEHMWFTIIASTKDQAVAQDKKWQAYRQGFFPDILLSSDYPALKPGYYIVVVSVADNKDQAVKNQKTAKEKGWTDAYSKKIR
ncbi:MAG: hypothetical protein ABIH00_06090 [Armatimonadota bacterium]